MTVKLTSQRARRPMTVWRLELLRLRRSRGGLALAITYLMFGFLGPVVAKYMQDLVKHVQSGVTITVATPTPKDGIAVYVNQVSQTGLIVVVVVAASALCFDARRGMSTFFRTRADSTRVLVLPRFAVAGLSAAGAYALGTLAAWYETALLIGSPPIASMLVGLVYGCVYLVFAVAVVTGAAALARSVLGVVGIALAALLGLPLVGALSAAHDWLPSRLATAPIELLDGAHPGDYLLPAGVAVGSAAALVATAVVKLSRREQ